MCWGCFASPLIGSVLGNSFHSFALYKERSLRFKFASIGISSGLTFLTALAIKTFFNISFCGNEGFVLSRAIVIAAASAIVGLVYSLGVNYILNRQFPIGQRSPTRVEACCSDNSCAR